MKKEAHVENVTLNYNKLKKSVSKMLHTVWFQYHDSYLKI